VLQKAEEQGQGSGGCDLPEIDASVTKNWKEAEEMNAKTNPKTYDWLTGAEQKDSPAWLDLIVTLMLVGMFSLIGVLFANL